MEYIFDLLECNKRVDTTTRLEEARGWLTMIPGSKTPHSVSVGVGAGKVTFTDVASLNEYMEGADLGRERALVWNPKAKSDEVKVNLKNAAGAVKAPLHPVPPIAFIALGQAMADGKAKYELYNWRESEATVSVFYDAVERHLLAYLSGENHAKDSKVHHLAHVMAGCAILLDAELHGKLIDDRHHINGKTIEDMLALIKAK